MSGIIILINVFYYYSFIIVIFVPLQTIFPGSNTSIIIIDIVMFLLFIIFHEFYNFNIVTLTNCWK